MQPHLTLSSFKKRKAVNFVVAKCLDGPTTLSLGK